MKKTTNEHFKAADAMAALLPNILQNDGEV